MLNTIGYDNYNFGVELEFSNLNTSLTYIYEKSREYKVPLEYTLTHKNHDCKYDKWILDTDPTISLRDDLDIYGGEISSKILSDNKNDWQELKEICNLLKDTNSYISSTCSEHITIDISKYLNNNTFFETLYKLLIIFEKEIETFYMGDYPVKRKSKLDFATSMQDKLFYYLNRVDFTDSNIIDNIRNNARSFRVHDGVSFHNLKEKGLIEIRYPNGTLDPNIVQNNINFTLSLIDSIGNENIDLDYLNYLIKDAKEDDLIFKLNFTPYFKDKFNYLTSIISKDTTSKENFNKQYQKVIGNTHGR